MDFPLTLSNNVISGLEEFKQDLMLLLTEPKGGFLQSTNLGAHFSAHVDSVDVLDYGIRRTLEELRGVEVMELTIELPTVNLTVKYYDDIVNFQFDLPVNES